MTRFYVGQPVICVNGDFSAGVLRRFPQIRNLPKRGARYVIRANQNIRGARVTFVLLRELRNPVIRWPRGGTRAEAGFWEDRFEPATDIGDLTRVADEVGMFMGRDGSTEKRREVPQRKKEKAMELQKQGEFSVHQFFEDGSSETICMYVDADAAVEKWTQFITNVASRVGITRRVIIVDGMDCTVAMWEYGKGVTWPLPGQKEKVG